MTWSNAQQPSYDIRNFSTNDGLSNHLINSMMQDNRGFVWLGTNFGLNRFDGEKFESFTKANSNLVQDRTDKLFQDKEGKIWSVFIDLIDEKCQISIFNPLTNEAKSFQETFPKAPFDEAQISSGSFYSEDDNIWLVTTDGSIYKYEEEFKLFTQNEAYKNTKVRWLDGKCWLAKRGTLFMLDKNGLEQKRISIEDLEIFDFGKMNNGDIWLTFHEYLSIKNKILVVSEKSQQSKTIKIKVGEIQQIYNVKYYKDRFIIAGPKFLKIYDNNGKLLDDLGIHLLDHFPRVNTRHIFIDKEERFWISSNYGLILMSPKRELFKKYLANQNFSIRGITGLNEKELFVATYDGFYIININTTAKEKVKNNTPYDYGLGMDKLGNDIFIGFHFSMYLNYNFQSRTIETFFQKKGPDINSFYIDKHDSIWGITNAGVFLLDKEKKQINLPPKADTKHLFYKTPVYHILEKSEGLWVSTENGLFLIDYQGKVLEQIDVLENFEISFTHQSTKDDFWLATRGKGLLHWNKKSNELKRYTIEDGLSHDYLYSIHEDKFGFLWIPSNDGLMRLNPLDFSINIFRDKDGLTNNEFNTFSNYVDENGRIFLGGINGMVGFDPNDFSFLEEIDSPLRILSFSKTKKENEKKIEETEKLIEQQFINFETDDKFIDLSFALIDFSKSHQPKYAFQIEGYNETWNSLEDNQLRINRLPYGKYKLKIKGQSKYGIWSKQQIELPLNVVRPYYLKSWFYILSVVLLAALGYGLFRYRLYRLELEKMRLEKVVEDRTRELEAQAQKLKKYNQMKDEFFAIIAHDLRGPVISFQNISKKIKFLNNEGNQKDVDGMLDLVDTAAENINTLLDNLLNWALLQKGIFPYRPNQLNLKKMSDETVQLFRPMAKMKGIQIEQNISERVKINADKDAMSMILRNMISNAIKFSSEGDLVKINATNKDGNVLLEIEDSGIGMPPEIVERIFDLKGDKIKRGTKGEKGSGLGLVLCKELIELNKGSLKVKSEFKKGTAFSILLPMN